MKNYTTIYPAIQCSFCNRISTDTLVYRQRTMYEDEESNYVTACPSCKEENDMYWDDMWSDYYSNCM